MSLPNTIKALVQPSAESTELVLTTQPIPVPNPAADSTEHLIRVHAFSPCAGERLWVKFFPPPEEFLKTKELVPGYDLAGTVVTAPASSPFKPGDGVYCRTNYLRTGCAREYAIALTEELALRPKNLSWAETATVALSAETAWQQLFVEAGYEPIEGVGMEGVRVLVTAASGGVGNWTVQLARWAGADVVGTCGPDNIEFVKSLGASDALNYRSVDLKAWVAEDEGRKFDLIVDGAGGKSLESAWWAVKDGGKLVSIREPPEPLKPEGLAAKNVKAWFFIMESNGSQLEKITKLIDEGKCRTVVDSTWPLEEFEKAYERADSGHAKGKVVIQLTA